MNGNGVHQCELFALIWEPRQYPFRLRANDLIRFEGRLARVMRVTESAAVVLVSRPPRQFITRFDKPVRFRQPPVIIRISPNSEIEILNRKNGEYKKRKLRERRLA